LPASYCGLCFGPTPVDVEFSSSLILTPFYLPTRCRCRGLLLRLITLNGTQTHTHTHAHSFGRGMGPSRRPLPVKKRHSQKTDRRPSGGNRTHNPCKSTAACPSLATIMIGSIRTLWWMKRYWYRLHSRVLLLCDVTVNPLTPNASYTFNHILRLL